MPTVEVKHTPEFLQSQATNTRRISAEAGDIRLSVCLLHHKFTVLTFIYVIQVKDHGTRFGSGGGAGGKKYGFHF